MSHSTPPLETVWQLFSDLQKAQQTSEETWEERSAALGIGYAFAFAALAEAAIEGGVVDRERLKAWLASATAQAEAQFDHSLTMEILDQLYRVVDVQHVPTPA